MYKIKGGFLQLDETLVINRAERRKLPRLPVKPIHRKCRKQN